MSKVRCPCCGSTETVRIIYGLPTYELVKKESDGLIKLGGCDIDEDAPIRYCNKCKTNFGNRLIEAIDIKELYLFVGGYFGKNNCVTVRNNVN